MRRTFRLIFEWLKSDWINLLFAIVMVAAAIVFVKEIAN